MLASCAYPRQEDDAFVASVRSIEPSVVFLTMRVPPQDRKDRFDDAYGTGIVVASGDWGSDILTAQHVIEGAWDLHVTLSTHQKVPATVIAYDETTDVALVRTSRAHLPVAKLGSSAHLRDAIGRVVGLVGYPIPDEFDDERLGLAASLASGRLSSVRNDALEITIPIVPGESGGPVFIADTGEIIGLTNSRFDDEKSIGFATPIDDAKAFLNKHDAEHGF